MIGKRPCQVETKAAGENRAASPTIVRDPSRPSDMSPPDSLDNQQLVEVSFPPMGKEKERKLIIFVTLSTPTVQNSILSKIVTDIRQTLTMDKPADW